MNAHLACFGFGAALCCASLPAAAQTYPAQKNITSVIAFAAGGVTDVIARLLSQKVAEKTGKSIISENRGGAGGNLAARAVATGPADGYTILSTSTALAISATASRNRGFQISDLKPVAIVATTPDVIAVHPSNTARSLADYIASAKSKPSNFGSSGLGTPPHIATEYLLRIVAKLDVTHVTFTGGAPAVTAAMGNHIDLLAVSLPTAVAQINDGQLRGLGVASASRSKAVPAIPTYAESGFSGIESSTWSGFFVPANTPDAVVTWLNDAFNAALKDADVQSRLAAIGFEAIETTPASATRFFDREVEAWGTRTKAIGFVMN